MTIGIAAVGPHAVSVVIDALRATETLGAGAIGGFAVLTVMDHNGATHSCETQEGGSTQLVIPDSWLGYERAALISSGPHRPPPLSQFLASQNHVGLVTGHRLPNREVNGAPLNKTALQQLALGQTAQEAVTIALDADPECDAGLIALSATGALALANSARVQRRLDVYTAMHQHGDSSIALLMNSIAFPAIVMRTDPATLVAQIASQRFKAQTAPATFSLVSIDAHCQLAQADHDLIVVHASARRVLRIVSADQSLSNARGRRTIIQNGTPVVDTEGAFLGVSYNDIIANVTLCALDPQTHFSSLGLVIGPQP